MKLPTSVKAAGALLWKNFKIKTRHPFQVVVEILLPLLIASILVSIRTRNLKARNLPCFTHEKYQESTSSIMYARDFICFFNTSCSSTTYIDWNSTNLPESSLAEIVKNLTDIQSDVRNQGDLFSNTLVTLEKNQANIQKLQYTLSSAQAFLDPFQQLMKYLREIQNGTATDETYNNVSRIVCGTDKSDLKVILRIFSPKTEKNSANLNRAKRAAGTEQSVIDKCHDDAKKIFTSNVLLKKLFNYLEPMLWGKIYYTGKDNSFLEEVIRRANLTYRSLDHLKLAAIEWRKNYRDYLSYELTESQRVVNLRAILKLCQSNGPSDQVKQQCQAALDASEPTRINNLLDSISQLFLLIEQLLSCVLLDKYEPLAKNTTMDNLSDTQIKDAYAGIKFNTDHYRGKTVYQPPKLFSYSIRMSKSKIDGTVRYKVLDQFWTPYPRNNPLSDLKYYMSGFLNIQQALSDAYISVLTSPGHNVSRTPVAGSSVGTSIQIMPYPCYVVDNFIRFLGGIMPLLIIISWISTYCFLVKSIVAERESGTRQYMHILGVSKLNHWFSWLVSSKSQTTITCILMTILLSCGTVLQFSDPFVIFFILFAYCWSFICQACLVSTMFSHANIAGVVSGVIYFILYLPFIVVVEQEDSLNLSSYYGLCLSSQVGLCLSLRYVASWEQTTQGLLFSNLFSNISLDLQFSVGHCLLMLVLDGFVYLLLACYMDCVFPGKYGVPLPFYYFVLPNYWMGRHVTPREPLSWKRIKSWCIKPKTKKSKALQRNLYDNHNSENPYINNSNNSVSKRPNILDRIEPVADDLEVGISINKLTKTYGSLNAVDELSINFYQGQITAFLGHNGAGKTTTISILTGMIPATSGQVLMNGQELGCGRVNKGGNSIDLGLCPQHNVLFGDLTAAEHVLLYSRIRGLSVKAAQSVVDKVLEDVGLLQRGYKHVKASALSGGYKRKLSVALAFLGDVKAVFLDEPTAGVDPFARRGIWEMLLKYKQQDRTIILTTHHMDEADFLSDRIAIIARGKLCCIGSSVFLKRQYGEGYFLHLERVVEHLELPKCDTTVTSMSIENSMKKTKTRSGELSKSVKLLLEYLAQFVPNARIVEERRTEWVFVLPYQNQTVEFINLLKDLESKKTTWQDMGFVSFGITDTTLEEVFLKVVKETEEHNNASNVISPRMSIQGSPTTYSTDPHQEYQYANNADSDSEIEEDEYDKTIEFDSADMPMSIGNARIIERCGDSKILDMKDIPSIINPNNASIHGSEEGEDNAGDLEDGVVLLNGFQLLNQHIRALLLKRWYYSKRSIKGLIAELVLPILMMLLMIGVITSARKQQLEQPPMTIQPWIMVGKAKNLRTFFRSEYPGNFYPKNVSDVYRPMIELAKNMTELYVRPEIEAGIRCMLPGYASPSTAKPPIPECLHSKGSTPGPFPFRAASDNISLRTPDCDCITTGNPRCPPESGSPVTKLLEQKLTSGSGDTLMDLSKYNISDHLLKKFYNYRGVLFGGFQFLLPFQLGLECRAISPAFPSNLSTLPTNMTVFLRHMGYFVRSVGLKTSYSRVWVNTKGYPAMPAYHNILDNLMLRLQLRRLNGSSVSSPLEYGIMTDTYPFKYSQKDLLDQLQKRLGIELSLAVFVLLALSLVPASFVLFQVEERVTNSKHLQFVSGVRPHVYWFSMFVWDTLKFFIPIMMILVIFVCFEYESYIGTENRLAFILIMLLYSVSIIVHMYPFCFLFSVPSTGFVVMYSYNVLIGTITTITTFIMDSLSEDDESLKPINNVLKQVFLVFPQYGLGRGMMDLSTNYMKKDLSGGVFKYDPFEWQYTSEKLVAFTVQFVGWCAVLSLIESGLIHQRLATFIRNYTESTKTNQDRRHNYGDEEDEDVATERLMVKAATDKYNMKVQDITKIYNAKLKCPKCSSKTGSLSHKVEDHNEAEDKEEESNKRRIAVDAISFGVMPDECFGLLGINGAGKTTTFKMLTGAEHMTRGYAYICGVSVTKGAEAYRSLGYCPQFDALHSLLNVEEELRLFCLFRGIPQGAPTERVIRRSLHQLNLESHRHKLTSALSGGNKRKLSTALALIGSPKVIFLDEPTAGMDASARRFLWTRIQDLTRSGECRSVVLTSHNMEECEVLCHRLAIMVDGHIKCLGSIQHLKSKYGGDYQVKIRLLSTESMKSCVTVKCEVYNKLYRGLFLGEKDTDSNVEEYLPDFPDSSPIRLVEETAFSLVYRIEPAEFRGLALIFEFFDRLKRNAHISDFSISQTTLDEIFVNFASKHKKSAPSKILSVARNSTRKSPHNEPLPPGLLKSSFEKEQTNDAYCSSEVTC